MKKNEISQILHRMQDRDKQLEKKLKKQNDQKIAILKHKIQANQEKR